MSPRPVSAHLAVTRPRGSWHKLPPEAVSVVLGDIGTDRGPARVSIETVPPLRRCLQPRYTVLPPTSRFVVRLRSAACRALDKLGERLKSGSEDRVNSSESGSDS